LLFVLDSLAPTRNMHDMAIGYSLELAPARERLWIVHTVCWLSSKHNWVITTGYVNGVLYLFVIIIFTLSFTFFILGMYSLTHKYFHLGNTVPDWFLHSMLWLDRIYLSYRTERNLAQYNLAQYLYYVSILEYSEFRATFNLLRTSNRGAYSRGACLLDKTLYVLYTKWLLAIRTVPTCTVLATVDC